ncbi:MAG: hypothetical protein ACKO7N_07390 [Candidatus Nitrosotenuis sp.]
MKLVIFLTILGGLSFLPVSFAESGIYPLVVDEKSFEIPYQVDGQIIAMKIDNESKSLLIGLNHVKESTFRVSLPTELISATNDNFVVLVDGYESDFVLSNSENNPSIRVPISDSTEEIEIIGTRVIPEFPLGILFVVAVMISLTIIMTKSNLPFFR